MDRSVSFCDKPESINIEPLSLKLNKRIILEKHQSFISTNKKGSTHGGQSDCVIEMPIPHKDHKSNSYNKNHCELSSDPDRSYKNIGKKKSVNRGRSVSFCDKRESINIEPLSLKLNKRIMLERKQSFISTNKNDSHHGYQSDCVTKMPIHHEDNKLDSYNKSYYDVSSDPNRSDNKSETIKSVKMDQAVSFCDERESINIEPRNVQSYKPTVPQSNQSFISTNKERSSHDDESDNEIEMMLPPPETTSEGSSEIFISHQSQYSDCVNNVQLLIKKYSQNDPNQAHYDG
ncbi:hypothetical protein RF11_08223 [Thelohanellus kitauei]|uniref:Uncharacterized protein n=1 Tax=Thelohanellus kitauei TaxID=669202 RepID=A0A0C2N2J7_THEKT|nr:hypothetical protein RF11_08223 [Thelohanellus kitauei]